MFDPKEIFVTTDFSKESKSALAIAIEMAKRFSLPLTIVHVVPCLIPYPFFYYGALESAPAMDLEIQNQSELKSHAEEEIDKWFGNDCNEVTVQKIVLDGLPSQALLAFLQEHPNSLTVMSTHGYGFFKRTVLGSVANVLVQESPSPILTVRSS